jgi:ribosomal-protein-alanine N-acetyltransferase
MNYEDENYPNVVFGDRAIEDFPIIETDRLRLRQIRQRDAEDAFAFLSHPEVARYIGSRAFTNLLETRVWLARGYKTHQQGETLRWGIALRDTDQLIGECNYHHFGPRRSYAEIGYQLQYPHWNKGYMSEALTAILSYGFDVLKFHRVEANVDPLNERSRGLLLKLGFAHEGTLRQRYYLEGEFLDEAWYGLLRTDWQARLTASQSG